MKNSKEADAGSDIENAAKQKGTKEFYILDVDLYNDNALTVSALKLMVHIRHRADPGGQYFQSDYNASDETGMPYNSVYRATKLLKKEGYLEGGKRDRNRMQVRMSARWYHKKNREDCDNMENRCRKAVNTATPNSVSSHPQHEGIVPPTWEQTTPNMGVPSDRENVRRGITDKKKTETGETVPVLQTLKKETTATLSEKLRLWTLEQNRNFCSTYGTAAYNEGALVTGSKGEVSALVPGKLYQSDIDDILSVCTAAHPSEDPYNTYTACMSALLADPAVMNKVIYYCSMGKAGAASASVTLRLKAFMSIKKGQDQEDWTFLRESLEQVHSSIRILPPETTESLCYDQLCSLCQKAGDIASANPDFKRYAGNYYGSRCRNKDPKFIDNDPYDCSEVTEAEISANIESLKQKLVTQLTTDFLTAARMNPGYDRYSKVSESNRLFVDIAPATPFDSEADGYSELLAAATDMVMNAAREKFIAAVAGVYAPVKDNLRYLPECYPYIKAEDIEDIQKYIRAHESAAVDIERTDAAMTWHYHIQNLRQAIATGRDAEKILLAPCMQMDAWFRVIGLVTHASAKVTERYGEQAEQEFIAYPVVCRVAGRFAPAAFTEFCIARGLNLHKLYLKQEFKSK